MPHRVFRQAPLHSSLKLSCFAARQHLLFVLNAAAAFPDFGRRTARAHYLQPPPQLSFKLPPRLIELASLQPWCYGNKQRVRLLCCCRPLSTLTIRFAHEVDREGGCRLQ